VEKCLGLGNATYDNMAHAHCFLIPNATNTHTGCVIFVTFLLQQWLHEPTSMLNFTYIASLVLYMISLYHALI